MPAGVRSGNTREQRAGHLCGRSDRGGIENQRDLHREWTLPQPVDRRRPKREAGGGSEWLDAVRSDEILGSTYRVTAASGTVEEPAFRSASSLHQNVGI